MTFQAVLLYKNNVHLLYQSDSSIQLHCGIIKINRQCVLNINAGMNMRWTIYLFLLFFFFLKIDEKNDDRNPLGCNNKKKARVGGFYFL